MTTNKKLTIFENSEIRRTIHNDEWRFSIEDIVLILTNSSDPKQYIKKMRSRDGELNINWGTICTPLELLAKDGKNRKISCVNTKGAFRVIQSIPSPRAEPLKQRLAQVGYDRIKEIEDPELTMKRMIETYEKKGYPQERIDIRSRGIPVRKALTNERDQRGAQNNYGVLTNEIYRAYAGMSNAEWKEYKGIERGNLRDGMTPIELILTMLAEQATTDITRTRNAQGVIELKQASNDGGHVAFKARQELIEQTGKDPITDQNYLQEMNKPQKIKKSL